MSERELVAAILGSWISGGIVIGVMMWLQERRWRQQTSTAERTIVHDELLRNIVKQTLAMQEIASELRVIAEVVMMLDTTVSKEERQGQ